MSIHQVLVVDDDDDIRESLIDYLQDHGYQPVGATDGQDALDKLRAAGVRPCVIILDLMMPNMDGRAFREEQLRNPELSAIPVVVISAYRDISSAAEGMNVAGHLSKPVSLSALLQVVQVHCAPV